MTTPEYHAQVDARARQIVEYVAEHQGESLWTAHALLALDRHHDRITDIIKKGLSGRTTAPDVRPAGGPFQVLPCMLLVSRWRDKLPDKAVAAVRDFFVEGVLERGNTENHWLMYYAGNLLAAEQWPDVKTFWNGLPPEAMRREATRWILGMIERTAVHGHHEYDSPQYHIEHLISMLGLADLARDAHLRRQTELVLSILVADMALEYFYGAWAGGHSREGYRQNTWTRTGAIPIIQYLYFGGEDFDPAAHVHGFGVYAAVAHYRPPRLFAEMAWDRSKPHIVKKTRAPRTICRHAEREAAPVRKYTYMSRSFALGSTQVGLPGAPAGPIDLVSWDLTWRGPNQQAKIVCNHPYRGAGRFSAFLAGLPQGIGRAIGSDKPYLQWPDRLFGASPYERMMQHEGAVIVLYRIPEDDETPFVNLFLPKSTAWVERDGWIMGDMGDFYVALRPVGPYDWQEIREANNANIMVTDADLINGWLLRIHTRNAGFILEAVEADEAKPFEDFCARRTACHLDLTRWPDDGVVAVDTLKGVRLEMAYDGPHRVDGVAIDYASWPLYEAPGVEAPLGTGKMVFRRGDDEVRLDFGIDPEKPLIPMRVIG